MPLRWIVSAAKRRRSLVEPPYTVLEHVAGDGYAWRYRRYPALSAPRAEIVFLHGIQSHAGWYDGTCTRLARDGYNISFLDRRGAGMNARDRGDAPSFRRLLDDVAEFLSALPRTAPRDQAMGRLPLIVAGISWGGKLAVALERRHPGLMDGLVLLCPGFFSRVRSSLLQRLKIFFCRLVRPRKLFPVPLNEPELFTANPRWQEFLRQDPLRLLQATARLMIESVRLDAYLRFVPKYVHVPVLLLLAEQDRIINNLKTRTFVSRFATPDKEIVEYPGAHHTLEFEPNPELWWVDLARWLSNKFPLDGKTDQLS